MSDSLYEVSRRAYHPAMDRKPVLCALAVLLAFAAVGCKNISRRFNQALPEFLRAEPGAVEMKIFAEVRQARDWTPEELKALNVLALMPKPWDDRELKLILRDAFYSAAQP